MAAFNSPNTARYKHRFHTNQNFLFMKLKNLNALYVVTKPYRAPEVLLNPGNYGSPVDVWALGCILGEMINKEVIFKQPQKDNPIEQIKRLFKLVGMPTETELRTCANENSARYIMSQGWTFARADFSSLFSTGGRNMIDLLDSLLVFNPSNRITLTEILEHDYLDDYRDCDNSCLLYTSPSPRD